MRILNVLLRSAKAPASKTLDKVPIKPWRYFLSPGDGSAKHEGVPKCLLARWDNYAIDQIGHSIFRLWPPVARIFQSSDFLH